jgi:hypothetical protein
MTGPRFAPNPWRNVLDFFALTALFCAMIAGILTLPAPSVATFLRYLLITELVGMSGVTCGTLVSRFGWLRRRTPLSAHAIIAIVAIPVGYVAGSSLAYALLGEPAPILSPGPRRIIALVVTALAAIFIVYLDSMRNRVAAEAGARAEAQRLALESQLRLLRAQLEPHMLFNTLANLRSLVDVDTRLAQSMIDQLIVYLRSALAASRQDATTLASEFAQLRAYLEIMSLRMGPRLAWRLDLPEALQQARVPSMLLQPLVENAIKHGLEPKIGDGTIEVVARQADGALEIAVTDSGLGLPPDETQAQTDAAAAPAGTQAAAGRAGSGYGLAHDRRRRAGRRRRDRARARAHAGRDVPRHQDAGQERAGSRGSRRRRLARRAARTAFRLRHRARRVRRVCVRARRRRLRAETGDSRTAAHDRCAAAPAPCGSRGRRGGGRDGDALPARAVDLHVGRRDRRTDQGDPRRRRQHRADDPGRRRHLLRGGGQVR